MEAIKGMVGESGGKVVAASTEQPEDLHVQVFCFSIKICTEIVKL